MRVLELSDFSAGACGVWERAKQESIELAKRGHEVRVFSSNATKGSTQIANSKDQINSITIQRFPYIKLGGESFMFWNFYNEAVEFAPDIIIAHNYRHPHTSIALKVAKKINAKCFLVTHAPFIEGNYTRSKISSLMVGLYDKFIGPKIIRKFDKVISISKWENSYLKELGMEKEDVVFIPNGLPEAFFKKNSQTKSKQLLFFGRIAPIKNLESIMRPIAQNKKIKVDIVGTAETAYLKKLKKIVKELKISNQVKFFPPIFNQDKKIALMSKYEFFILPSKREAMPQALLEAMSRGAIPITSAKQGGMEVVENNKNGFIFENEKELSAIFERIFFLTKKQKQKLSSQAIKTSQNYNISYLTTKLEKLF